MLGNESIQNLRGIGEKTARLMEKVGVRTVRDLLYYLPRDYKDFSNIKRFKDVRLGETALFEVKVTSLPQVKRIRRGLEITSFEVTDAGGIATVDIFNQTYIRNYITVGKTLYLYGKLEYKYGKGVISSPEIYFEKPDSPYLPVYPLTGGLNQNMMRKFMRQALYETEIREPYSDAFLARFSLPSLKSALHAIHFPRERTEADRARTRIVFDELLLFNRMMQLLGEEKRQKSSIAVKNTEQEKIDFAGKLPFSLTDAQIRVMSEISQDLQKDVCMNRLVQGDVGSGKTVLAFFAMQCMRKSGYQSVLMAPTEILARQHWETATRLFPEEEIVLVTGALNAAERRKANDQIETGAASIVIGTHALLYGNASFANLGLIITDEQHRFGVKQRAALAGNNRDVHTLIMSATPIPRSLSLVLFGNTDISIVDELPPGRKAVKTYLIHENKYHDMISFVQQQLQQQRQAYIVCPLIEDSEGMDARSASGVMEELNREYRGHRLALLHGKLKNSEKQQIMEDFAAGKIDMLVSTTVIEVGINVPNATVMVIMNAERFGLAQLHQLRGRVGRGNDQSYCFLVSDLQSAYERLRVLTATSDGFEIAEQDMKLRGTGDILGTRQHGDSTLKVANLIADARLLEKTGAVLQAIAENPAFIYEYNMITTMAKDNLENKILEIALN
ncbi:MAG: ATP-dependent DNA helicase RecG [Christensenella sp.]|nr:ATP-dependent DNA helicase RecG [Christensenella sp.]